MSANIITKYAVASDKMVDELLHLIRTWSSEHPGNEIDGQYTRKPLVNSMNSFSSQWLVTYHDDEPAGFALLTEGGERPEFTAGRRAVQLSLFAVIKKYAAAGVGNSLLEKCLHIYKNREMMWMEPAMVQEQSVLLENYGFTKSSEYLVKEGL
ncbi:GNAT family N-acetyltransferase [Chitinophaga sp. 212800010-3]|uniref:GNAT family N-acetyltransferase n=1 Tax=unclassified Chitinophaga TaxID=2619133 RepID=UPI002DF14509|nr:N-acetyltransferase domain-containing protein [Chitinophaga sp. 212800010-3]